MALDYGELKQRTRAVWSLGDYTKIAERLTMPAAVPLVDACAISAGQDVLDVAAGTGNVAVLAAREGARVVASDLTPALIEIGQARTEAEQLEVAWAEADVEDLPFEDASFDCVASVFGAMFGPQPDVTASEMFRVLRPGGTVGMANWTPDSFLARMTAVTGKYLPAPEGLPSPMDWGVEDVVRSRLEGLGSSVEVDPLKIDFDFDTPEDMWQFFASYAGPLVAARQVLDDAQVEGLKTDFIALVREMSTAGDRVAIPSEYLQVVARKRG